MCRCNSHGIFTTGTVNCIMDNKRPLVAKNKKKSSDLNAGLNTNALIVSHLGMEQTIVVKNLEQVKVRRRVTVIQTNLISRRQIAVHRISRITISFIV